MTSQNDGTDDGKMMDDRVSDFWQSHSIKFLEMAFRTDRQERIQGADGHGKKTGDCGDTVEFFMVLKGDRIETLAYDLHGCVNTNACANAVLELLEGKTMEAAWEIRPEDVADYLESLPEDHFHCAELAVGALYLTLASARETKRSPWKKMYTP
jgi:nitrogen fixation protein NifU and related proteins